MPQLGDMVQISINTRYGLTLVTGAVISLGEVLNKPDVYWLQIAGMTTTFYSDDELEIKVI